MTELSKPVQATRKQFERVTMDDIETLGYKLNNVLDIVRQVTMLPEGAKVSPLFNATQLAALCSKTPEQMTRLLDKGAEKGLPDGFGEAGPTTGKGRRQFTLAEARQWVNAVGPEKLRKEGQPGAVICVANFKGGVGKTVSAMSLAQGLSLKGYDVLCIDYDPQGSLTSLFGLNIPDIAEEDTVMPLMAPKDSGFSRDTLQQSIRNTYWDGVDLVPASHSLFAGEFYLPMRQMNSTAADSLEPDFKFYSVLDNALNEGIRQHYDFVVIDTPPSLSYMTMTTFWAADALLLPLPPEGLDFVSSSQFWQMLSDLASGTTQKAQKTFSWVAVVPSKVDHSHLQTKTVLKWMQMGYEAMMLNTEIPDTAAVRVGGSEFKTVYDIAKYIGSQKTLTRAREAYDKLVDEVVYLTSQTLWAEDIQSEEV